jgi:hypothetical protein
MAQSKSQSDTTVDHDHIRGWAEKRGGIPATVKGTGKKNDAGILRLDFEPRDAELEEISWDMFFEKFDKESLAFLYQEKTAGGQLSRFHKFVERDEKTTKTTTNASKAATVKSAAPKRAGSARKPAATSTRGAQGQPAKRASSKKV